MKIVAFTVLGCCAAAYAQPDGSLRFDIPPQRIADALNDFAQQSGLQVLIDWDDSRELTSPAVSGAYLPEIALKKLLADSGLGYRYLDVRTISIRAEKSAPKTGANTARLFRNASGAASKDPDAVRLVQGEDANAAAGQPVPANAAESQGARQVEQIVVTAQRREERLIDTPISIGVLSGEDLDRDSSRSVADVLNRVAGVVLTEDRPGAVSIAVRGVQSGAGGSPTAYYQDEVPIAYVTTSGLPDTNAFDLSRVEVLRGAQGTLYGNNALSGVVRVLTNDPNLNDFEAKGRVRGSNTEHGGDNYGSDLAVNVPLIPGKLAIRGVASYSHLSGFIDSVPDRAPFNGGTRINDTKAQAFRLKVAYQPIDDFSVKFGFSRSDIENGAPSTARDNFTTIFSVDQPDTRVIDTYNLVAEYNWSKVSLLSSTSYLEYDPESVVDALLSGIQRFTFIDQRTLHAFSQEFRLMSRLEGPWQWSAGAFYRDATEKLRQDARPLFVGVNRWAQDSESYAVFGEATRSFADDRFELTAGARYFADRVGRMDIGYLSGNPNLAAPIHVDFDRLTGRLVLAYKPQTNRMYYSSVATGFRSGIPRDTGLAQAGSDFPALKPDSLTTYELGAKGELSEGALAYDLAVYYMDWKDIQQLLVVPAGFSARVNAGTAKGPGVEAGLSFQPTRSVRLNANLGWSDLKMDEDVFSRGVALFIKGARINNSPEWTGSIGGNYRVATPRPNLDFVLSSTFSYGTERLNRFLLGALGVAQTQSDPLHQLNASAGLEAERWSLVVYGDNLLNDDGQVTAPSSSADSQSIRLRPRTIGLQASFNY